MKLFYILLLIVLLLIYNNQFGGNKLDNDLVIIKNFYNPSDLNKINYLLKNTRFKSDDRVTSRKTTCLFQKKNKQLFNLIYNNKLINLIKKLTHKKMIIPDYPIEYRIYPTKSEGINWHRDLSLYKDTYYEAVLTLHNNSDQQFQYIKNGKLYTVSPSSNTLALVKPNGILHKVTPITKGTRTILKFIILFNNKKKNKQYYEELNKCPN